MSNTNPFHIFNGDNVIVNFMGGTQASGQVYNMTAAGFTVANHIHKSKVEAVYSGDGNVIAGLTVVDD